MARTLPTGYAALTTAKTFRPVFFVFLDWPGDAVRAWNGYGNIIWNGETWYGTGALGTLSPITESSDGTANGLELSLSGIPSDLVAKAMGNDYQGAAGRVWMSALTADGALEADPLQIFDGFVNVCPGEDAGETCTITVQLEKELIDRRLNNRRRTHEDQQIDYPGDLFFEYVATLSTNPINFGPVANKSAAAEPSYYPTAQGLVYMS